MTTTEMRAKALDAALRLAPQYNDVDSLLRSAHRIEMYLRGMATMVKKDSDCKPVGVLAG